MRNAETKRRLCYKYADELSSDDVVSREKGGKNDAFIERIHYVDGSAKVFWGGPCGSSCYDEFGEEC